MFENRFVSNKKLMQGVCVIALVLASIFLLSYLDRLNSVVVRNNIKNKALFGFSSYKEYGEGEKLFDAVIVANYNGDLVTLPEDNKYTILNIWSVRSKDSLGNIDTFPSLKRVLSLNNSHNDWNVVAVSIDGVDDIQAVHEYIKRKGMVDLAGYYDVKGLLKKRLGDDSNSLPVTFIIDDKGEVLYELSGKVIWANDSIVTFLRYIRNGNNHK